MFFRGFVIVIVLMEVLAWGAPMATSKPKKLPVEERASLGVNRFTLKGGEVVDVHQRDRDDLC